MQTHFTTAQLEDPDVRESEKILRACVHCGFCTATCPTYALLGDELDSPRGRIYLIKDMLETGRAPTAEVVKHVDRCLSCLSCMTTCPSGVNYMHLVDHARHHIAATFKRPLIDRVMRRALGLALPRPKLFRALMRAAGLAAPLAGLLPGRLGAALSLVPRRLPAPSPVDRPQVFASEGAKARRVALLGGCAQQVLAPEINEATIRLLTRHGCEVVVAAGAGCCGALTHHLGQDGQAFARANVVAWTREIERGGLDAIVVNASGCGTTVKDYGFLFRNDPTLAAPAAVVAALARDVTELVDEIGLLRPAVAVGRRVAYHSACSLQHGQRVRDQPKALLRAAGFVVVEPPEAHLCCGSAGTYNLLQPELATRLRDRKAAALESVSPDLVAAGNIGCLTQIAAGTALPVAHTVELLDWATGGPRPRSLPA
ncbi:glycolate oxidase iron-sulfur subunit [Roseiarcus fermentans]|uniref:Glycolate oxidase iron-sulfur subunit n=1 Tax=Roseiarcus fermentans TaxID=1473586 RepID=A0A366FT00_9HYPH|nr:glycolate oxidase subunit GlcF [Roseiarcus fermentans]RBP17170.1 glycolate oxidase iron-sulfur subunit [Roseiarcus fermentans]